MFKEYNSYTSLMLRLLVNVLIPLLTIGLATLSAPAGMAMYITSSVMLISMDLLSDGFAFTGICRKHGAATSFMQSSFRGEKFFVKLVTQDIIVRFVRDLVVTVLCSIGGFVMYGFSWDFMLAIVNTMIFTNLGVLVVRHIEQMQFMVFAGMLFAALGAIAVALTFFFLEKYVVLISVIELLVVAATIVIDRWYMVRCYRKGFSDND